MHKNFIWCTGCNYFSKDKDGNIYDNYKNRVCFSGLSYKPKENSTITIHKFKNEESLVFTDFYIDYIIKMLDLKNVVLEDNSFTFKSFSDRNKNLLVLTLIRILFESLGDKTYKDKYNLELFNNLKNGKCKYRNKLKRFCYFYHQLSVNNTITYWASNHSPHPKEVIIRSTKDFKETDFKKINVNNFFYGKK